MNKIAGLWSQHWEEAGSVLMSREKQRGEGGDWIGKLGENSLGDKGEQGAGRFKGLCGRERALR